MRLYNEKKLIQQKYHYPMYAHNHINSIYIKQKLIITMRNMQICNHGWKC